MRRIVAFFTLIVLLVSMCINGVLAAAPEVSVPYASSYISRYAASAATGDGSGEIDISFLITSPKANLTKIGVSKIVVYRYDGTPMRTYYGSTSNALLTSNVYDYTYTYTITNLEPGTSYYAEVTVIAADSSGSDTRTVTTNTVKAGS